MVLLNPLIDEAEKNGDAVSMASRLALHIITLYGLVTVPIEVPTYFPLDMADYLREKKVTLTVQRSWYPERAIKKPEEVDALRTSLKKTFSAFTKIEELLRSATIDGACLSYQGVPLTSEFLKQEVERVLFEERMHNAEGLIIASGSQGAIPHHPGAGNIESNRPIVCDIFPVSRDSGYFADMTRTYLVGVPDPYLLTMYDAVREAQEAAFALLRPGVRASEVHTACCDVFLKRGFTVGDTGFTHGTGHGLGLEVHESPVVNRRSKAVLVPGNVITIEPGLYYPAYGGVRIEDVVVITENGFENLTPYPKVLVIG